MAYEELLDQLVATYRDLNFAFRSDAEVALPLDAADISLRDLLLELRDSELRFSQALKERLIGVPMPDLETIFATGESGIIGTEGEIDRITSILTQFGTAREATLSMLRPLTSTEWDEHLADGAPIHDRVEQLVANDRLLLQQLASRHSST